MPIIVQCPQCSRKLRVPDDLLGQKVQCPTCNTLFIGQVESTPSTPVAPPPERQPLPEPKTPPTRERPERRDAVPHRGGLILVLGVLSIVTGLGFILGPIAWLMASGDLKQIRAGLMERDGESQTNTGMVLGIVGTILGVLGLCCCGAWGLQVMMYGVWAYDY
jgi:predicted Zn finger-like uncharacterized protein